MARFFGRIGFATVTETAPGVWDNVVVEKSYYGDVVRKARTFQDQQTVAGEVTVSHSISVVADEYANQGIEAIRYVRWSGALWNIESIEVQRPRLILGLGGKYNGPTPTSSNNP